jgi:hypothetical protein
MTRRGDDAAAPPHRIAPHGPAPREPWPREPGRHPLTPARVAELRRRIAGGACDTPEMADRVARRILASGDVWKSEE